MKFFTWEWWRGDFDEKTFADVVPRYRAHIASIADRLPADLMRLENEISIHDSKLVRVDSDFSTGTTTYVLDGFFTRAEGFVQGDGRSVVLEFSGVRSAHSFVHKGSWLDPTNGYGEIGYWETDLDESGLVFRMITSSGIESHIHFDGISLSVEVERSKNAK